MTTDPIANETAEAPTHSLLIGYVLWIFGFLGSHRFYFGKPISGRSGSSPSACSASAGWSTSS